MECGYRSETENAYRAYRKRAAINNDSLSSMEKAAEQLGISVSSLNQYELGITKNVPVDMVVMMSDVYKAPELRNYYCRCECPIGRQLPLATEAEDLRASTLRLLDCLDEDAITNMKKRLISIAVDGRLTKEEENEFGDIVDSLEEIAKATSALRMVAEKL